MSESLENTCRLIKEKRLSLGLSQTELAALTGLDRAQISRIESYKERGVTIDTIEKILNALGMELVVKPLNR
ncbi:MAG: helix-turn-helix transcriptional regulator [Coprobacillus sp.]|nr:helix-turn-helix transcriptional regulator [Coprobacillus sp.]